MKSKHVVVTIDGPVAGGKSTLAQVLAKKLGYYYLNTGLLYRAVAYIVTHLQGLEILPDNLDFITDITYEYQHGQPTLLYRGVDITLHLYTTGLDMQASLMSADKRVREALLAIQRNVARKYSIVADGRDCGSVVFPAADVKFFLTADVDTRAKRLLHDSKRAYADMSFNKIKQALIERDNRDRVRDVAPLRVPEHAIVIDNSHMNQEETLQVFFDAVQDVAL